MTWMVALRDHPERPPAAQVHVLSMLALRLDWSTGAGFASNGQLASDAQCEERTVKRATKWAREHEMLVQTRRGHRVSAERAIASEWRLTLPVDNETQQDTEVPLGESQGDRGRDPRGHGRPPKGTPAHPHQDLDLQGLYSSERRRSAGAPRTPTPYQLAVRPPGLYGEQPWCGKCERHTHLREDDQGRPYRCPECHPGMRANGTVTAWWNA